MTENFRFHPFFLCVLVFAVTVSVASPALAHRLNVFVLPEDGRVTGEAYFNDGAPAANCPVRLTDSDGAVLEEGRTDVKGAFTLALPETDSPLTVVVEGGVGHRGETTLNRPVRETSPAAMDKDRTSAVRPPPPASGLSSGELQALVQDAVRREVAPLKEELLHLNQRLSRPGLTEILGGLGYIVGLTGVALWAGGRRKHG